MDAAPRVKLVLATMSHSYFLKGTTSLAQGEYNTARLLNLVFDIDLRYCSNRGGNKKIFAAILESRAITKILDHLGLSAWTSPGAPAQIHDFSSQPDPLFGIFNPLHSG
ncbi:hypothetical protein NTGM5_440016 [Candidatus Nitrotoga sp. M5]|nr:hypothetical protein NTGM5_440016 [Candidatus Nitrotoga sp. M5]